MNDEPIFSLRRSDLKTLFFVVVILAMGVYVYATRPAHPADNPPTVRPARCSCGSRCNCRFGEQGDMVPPTGATTNEPVSERPATKGGRQQGVPNAGAFGGALHLEAQPH